MLEEDTISSHASDGDGSITGLVNGLAEFEGSPAQFLARVTGAIEWKTSDSMTVGSATDTLWIDRGDLTPEWGWQIKPAELPSKGKKHDAWVAALPAGVELLTASQAQIWPSLVQSALVVHGALSVHGGKVRM